MQLKQLFLLIGLFFNYGLVDSNFFHRMKNFSPNESFYKSYFLKSHNRIGRTHCLSLCNQVPYCTMISYNYRDKICDAYQVIYPAGKIVFNEQFDTFFKNCKRRLIFSSFKYLPIIQFDIIKIDR